jgi:hypothetical protein
MRFPFKSLLRSFERWISVFGFSARHLLLPWPHLKSFWVDYFRLAGELTPDWPITPSFPCLGEKSEAAGGASGAYFHQDFLVARKIFERNPRHHIDVGSRVDGFVAHVATFRPIEILDIRPCRSFHPNAIFQVADLSNLATVPRSCCDSASCLHALEHFGLGRYGDPIGANHWKSGLTALSLMLESGGQLYLSVPIGRQRVEFNAHRVFHVSTILQQASSCSLLLDAFSFVDDAGDLHAEIPASKVDDTISGNLIFGCGIFEFIKFP